MKVDNKGKDSESVKSLVLWQNNESITSGGAINQEAKSFNPLPVFDESI